MDDLYNLLDSNSNKFYFNEATKKKFIIYKIYKKYTNTYTSHIEKKEYNIGNKEAKRYNKLLNNELREKLLKKWHDYIVFVNSKK